MVLPMSTKQSTAVIRRKSGMDVILLIKNDQEKVGYNEIANFDVPGIALANVFILFIHFD